MRLHAYQRQKDLPINNKQKAIIKMAQGKLCIDDQTYRDILEERFGVRSCTRLTWSQASAFIKELEGKGFSLLPSKVKEEAVVPPNSKSASSRKGKNVIALATRAELEKIDQVAALIEWRSENGLSLFLQTRMKIKGGRIRTSEEAFLAIEGLKKMFENGMKKTHGAAWWTGKYSDAVNEYIRLHKPAEWRQGGHE